MDCYDAKNCPDGDCANCNASPSGEKFDINQFVEIRDQEKHWRKLAIDDINWLRSKQGLPPIPREDYGRD